MVARVVAFEPASHGGRRSDQVSGQRDSRSNTAEGLGRHTFLADAQQVGFGFDRDAEQPPDAGKTDSLGGIQSVM